MILTMALLLVWLLVSAEALSNSNTPSSSSSSSPRTTRRMVRNRAPLVDSTLLRFLTNQEQSNRRRLENDNNPLPVSAPTKRATDSILLAVDDAESESELNLRSSDRRSVSSTVWDDEAAWIAQYERSHVAALLHAAGSLDAAIAAGMVVENMAVERAAKKRVRCFLKERNSVLGLETRSVNDADTDVTNSADVESSDNDSNDDSTCSFSSRNDNMQQVVDLMLEYGLSAKDVCEILIHSPGIAFMRPRKSSDDDAFVMDNGESLQSTLERVLNLLMGRTLPYELGLRKYDSRKVIRNTPGLLTVRGSHSATQMVQMLVQLGVSCNAISRDKAALPVLLSRQPAAVFRLVAFLSSDAVRMPIDKIGPLLRRAECQDLLNAIAPVPRLEQRQRWQLPSAMSTLTVSPPPRRSSDSAAVAAQVQQAVITNVYRRMSQTVQALRNEIGTYDLGRVIAAFPSVLLLDASRQILPTAHYLMNELGICQDDLPSVLQLYPALLRMDVEQMRNVVAYLMSLEVSEDNLGSIFRSFPVLLTLDIEHDMEPVVDFLRSIGVSNVGRFISRLPPVLCYSVEKELRPKFEFLTTVCTDARFEVSKFPAFFSYPLERVIKTRYEYLRDVKRIPTPLLSLDHVLCSGDKDFAMRVARDVDVKSYARFVEERRKSLAPVTTSNHSKDPIPSESSAAATSSAAIPSPRRNQTAGPTSEPDTPVQFPPSIAVIPT